MSAPSAYDKLSKTDINNFRNKLLAWYDENHRKLPWRAPPGFQGDPYHVWLSEIMLQQTVVAAVISYFLKFVKAWPTVHDLAKAPVEDVMEAWAGLGYYARARNLHKCAKVVSVQLNGKFPNSIEALKELPGIGDYTSAAITAIAFDKPATVVDGNVERVVARYFNLQEPLPGVKKSLKEHAALLSEGWADRPGDFAQAMMDLGAVICIPKAPRCALCPVSKKCQGRLAGQAAELPRRAPKKAKPQKFGHVYWIINEKDEVLFERRPDTVMLGGMRGLPTSEWVIKGEARPKMAAFLKKHKPGKIARDARIFHSFTHFDLELEGRAYKVRRADIKGDQYIWIARDKLLKLELPTLFKKFVKIMA